MGAESAVRAPSIGMSYAGILVILLGIMVVVGIVVAIVAALTAGKTKPVTGSGSYFDGNTFQLIGYRILSAFVCGITLGIAYPWMLCLVQGWEAKHTVIHGRRLKFTGHGHQLIGKYILWLFLTVITFGIYGIWLGLSVKKWVVKHTVYADDNRPVPSHFSGGVGGYLGIHLAAILLTLFTFGIGKAWADKMVISWETRHTHIGGSPLVFSGTGGQLFVKYLLLILLTPLTLGIYALFFTVSLKKWQASHTEAVYQTPEIQAKARAHEASAVQNYAKYRIAANDQEIAAMRSGFTGREDPATLEQMAREGNPFAAYKLAGTQKGYASTYEGRALELLQIAAGGKYHPALLELAKQQPAEVAVPMLNEAAQCGSMEATWLLYDACRRSGDLQQAAYWFRVALEWGWPEAQAHAGEYELLVKEIALQLAEGNSAPQKTGPLAVILGAVAGVVFLGILAFLAMMVLGIPVGRAEPAQNTQIIYRKTEQALLLEAEQVNGRRVTAFGDGGEYTYILNENVFYDDQLDILYVEFFLEESGDYALSLGDLDTWRTERLPGNGVLRIQHLYNHAPTYLDVYEENGMIRGVMLGNHQLKVTVGDSEDAQQWLADNYGIDTQMPAEPTEPAEATEATEPTEPPVAEKPLEEKLVGRWENNDGVELKTWCFYADGSYEYSYQNVAGGNGYGSHKGTYTLSGNTITIQLVSYDDGIFLDFLETVFKVEFQSDTLLRIHSSTGNPLDYTKK